MPLPASATQPANPPSPSRGIPEWLRVAWERGWLPVLLLAAATLAAYGPCLNGGMVWDDDSWTLKIAGLLQDVSGLGLIWTMVTAMQQYYPLTGTSFWIDYQLWGFWTTPYHVENVLLHVLAAALFWKLLARLEVPGAWLAAAILALHPVMVESAGWITERKNVLSLALYLGALLSYGRFAGFWREGSPKPGQTAPNRRWNFYGWALLLFLASLLAKATAFSLPAVLLLLCWWKRGRIRWRADVLPALPFFALTIGLGLVTLWLERNHVGAKGPQWAIPFPERCMIAGRAVCFYTGKLLWPANLCFIYPRWQINTTSPGQWLYPITAVGALLILWSAQGRIGRGPLAAALYFVGTLFPVLGFMNAYFMLYSFVCDHWCYLSSLGLIALAAALAARLAERLRVPTALYGLAAVLLPALTILTWRQSAQYSSAETLYRATLARNPNADLACNNLGLLLIQAGQADEAITCFRKAVEIRPDSAHAHNNLANAFRLNGNPREAIAHYEAALKFEPDNARTWNNLAWLLATSWDARVRSGTRAVEAAQRAWQLTGGRNPVAIAALAAAYAEAGRFPEAAATAQEALDLALARGNSQLASTLQRQIESYRAGSPWHEAAPTNAGAAEPGIVNQE